MKSRIAAEAAPKPMNARSLHPLVRRTPVRRVRAGLADLPTVVEARPYVAIAILWAALVLVAAVVGAMAMLGDGRTEAAPAVGSETPAAVTPKMLKEFAASHATPVYWAGGLRSRRLELTATRSGTFVRYLPVGVPAGDGRSNFTTIATYPLTGAYATALARRDEPGMASRATPGGGLAVWSREKPTSVYVAFRGVPQLVEVYAESGREARRLVLSGRIRPVG
jgi:hypothetical protein